MFKIQHKSRWPKFLIITPLRPQDKISAETRKTIKRNTTSFDWISYESDNNIPTNTTFALNEYESQYPKLNYLIKIDNDINLDRSLLDSMYSNLVNSNNIIGYCYCPFKFILPDAKEIQFTQQFNRNKLIEQNYISSNSMIKRNMLEYVGGFVTDGKYERLLDWAFWLRCLYYGFEGLMIPSKQFSTPLNENSVSNRGVQDYKTKYNRVYKDFSLVLK